MAKRKKKSRELPNANTPSQPRPSISVIIPMYNTEKYIGECLDSLLAQTFKDFEVIVVDDCSTDNSAVIVESYLEKFDGRLKVLHMKKNSGGAPVPRNNGTKFSSGEYLYFMDSDDAIVSTALEELHNIVKKYDANVVHCEKYYLSPDESASTDKKFLKESTIGTQFTLVNEPMFDTNSLKERIQKFLQGKILWTPWSHLIKREVILENDIEFPKLNIADDLMFTIYLYCVTEKFMFVPNTVYVWRTLKDSNSRSDWTNTQIERVIHRRVNDIFFGIQLLDKFTEGFELFQKEPTYKYALIDFFVERQVYHLRALYRQFPAIKFDHFIRKEFMEIGNDPTVATFLFDKMMVSEKNFMTFYTEQINKFNQFAAQAQNRIKELETQLADSRRRVAELEAHLN